MLSVMRDSREAVVVYTLVPGIGFMETLEMQEVQDGRGFLAAAVCG